MDTCPAIRDTLTCAVLQLEPECSGPGACWNKPRSLSNVTHRIREAMTPEPLRVSTPPDRSKAGEPLTLPLAGHTTLETVGQLVEACGGDKSVADWLGIRRAEVLRWRRAGSIPPGFHLKFYLRAQARGHRVALRVFGLPEGYA